MKRLTILSGIFLLLTTCTKEVDQFIADPIEFNIEEISSDIVFESEYTINGKEFTTITTPQGTEFEFEAGIFEFADGSDCDCSEIDIKIQEFQTPLDFILSEMVTGTQDLLLDTEGQFYVQAEREGQALKLKQGNKMHFHEPATKNEDLQLFYGEGSTPSWTWTKDISESLAHLEYATWDDFAGYEAYVDRLGWINMASALSTSQGVASVCVDLDLLTHAKNARAFAVAKDGNTVLPFQFDNDKECFCSFGLPKGLEIELVVIRKEAEGVYTYARQPATVVEDLEVHMEYNGAKYGNAEILRFLEEL